MESADPHMVSAGGYNPTLDDGPRGPNADHNVSSGSVESKYSRENKSDQTSAQHNTVSSAVNISAS